LREIASLFLFYAYGFSRQPANRPFLDLYRFFVSDLYRLPQIPYPSWRTKVWFTVASNQGTIAHDKATFKAERQRAFPLRKGRSYVLSRHGTPRGGTPQGCHRKY